MTVALSQAFKDATIEYRNPHCVGWVRATASLWGMASDHDLDEPVIMTNLVPVRLRYANSGRDGNSIVTDRALSLTSERAGTHIAIRFYFRNGKFIETDLIGIPRLNSGETTNLDPRSR